MNLTFKLSFIRAIASFGFCSVLIYSKLIFANLVCYSLFFDSNRDPGVSPMQQTGIYQMSNGEVVLWDGNVVYLYTQESIGATIGKQTFSPNGSFLWRPSWMPTPKPDMIERLPVLSARNPVNSRTTHPSFGNLNSKPTLIESGIQQPPVENRIRLLDVSRNETAQFGNSEYKQPKSRSLSELDATLNINLAQEAHLKKVVIEIGAGDAVGAAELADQTGATVIAINSQNFNTGVVPRHGKLIYRTGFAEHLLPEYQGIADLIYDVFGAFTYSQYKLELIAFIIEALTVGGKAILLESSNVGGAIVISTDYLSRKERLENLSAYLARIAPEIFQVKPASQNMRSLIMLKTSYQDLEAVLNTLVLDRPPTNWYSKSGNVTPVVRYRVR